LRGKKSRLAAPLDIKLAHRYGTDLMTSPIKYKLDTQQKNFDIFGNNFSQDVWALKYQREDEKSLPETIDRVVNAVMGDDPYNSVVYDLMYDAVLLPAGRILAGAGLDHHDSTLMNCYVMGVLDDSLQGIMDCLRESATTAKFGGGIGIDFTPLRPKGAPIATAAYYAGGPVAFMGLWDAMGHAMEAGGNRRGGKMGVLEVSHPDVLEFIEAKTKGGKLTGFNISVLISSAFMEAVEADEWWYFTHPTAPKTIVAYEDGPSTVDGYLWGRMKAKELWDKILLTTYQYSEPGVLFIDRINGSNPLYYRETIRSTNPCGEQPLPPYGACNLGSINLARCVRDPFGPLCKIDYELIKSATKAAITFLDKVLDITKYPLEQQATEAAKVRRIGLGITGLADLLAQVQIPYGSKEAIKTASIIMGIIANEAYITSAELADAKGSFPDYDAEKYKKGVFHNRLTPETQTEIEIKGLRNGLLLSIAPTGTISAVFGDVSSGCEPHFSHRTKRKIKVKDENNNDTWADYFTYSYTVRMYAQVKGISIEEAYEHIVGNSEMYPTAQNLPVEAHTSTVGALQHYVDSSISKTTNCPTEMSFEDFKQVYDTAYITGCKGCTTYRPREDMGAVLISGDTPEPSKNSEKNRGPSTPMFLPIKEGVDYNRGYCLSGKTYKLVWPDLPSPVFVTINHDEAGHPIELFIASKNALHNEWTVALSVLCSKLLQTGYPLSKVAEQLKQINLSTSTAYDNGRHYGSLVSRIGYLLEDHSASLSVKESISIKINIDVDKLVADLKEVEDKVLAVDQGTHVLCKFCGSRNTRKEEGCVKCNDCGQSKCD
jgi:ribonucleoside-diphosphate reductase alpha chain